MKRLVLSVVLPALLLALAGCGSAGNGDDDGTVDGGGADGGGCAAFVQFTPMNPVAPATVIARSDVFGAQGVITYTWQVRRQGVDIAFTPLDADSRDIEFEAATAGIYDVWLDVGGGCGPYIGSLNVMQQGAQTRSVRLRLVPPSSISAPPQERVYIIPGGADYAAGVVGLEAGNEFPVAVRTPQAAPVAAYLRFTSRATPDAIVEGFSDVTGNASVRLVTGRYDVLVVPTSASLAPRVITDWDPISGSLTIDAGQMLTGTVLDSAGVAVAGARVSLVSEGVPSTVATTAADGSFALRWRDGAGMEKVTVAPPTGSDLPRLDAQVAVSLSAITIRHAAVTASDVGNTLVRVGGAPAVSTDVLVDLSLPMAGTIRDGAGTNVLAQATGSHRATLRTDTSGRLPAARFVDGSGAMFIASPGPGARAAITLPLGGGPVDAAAAVTVTGHVLRSAGGDRAAAHVRATLVGALAYPGAPIPTAVAGSDGRFSLSLAAGASYELTISDPTVDDADVVIDIASAAGQDLGDRTLPAAIAISGEVRVSGQSVGARAVGVAALCNDQCTGIDRLRPLGDAVTDAGGRFVVAVPDPGVSQQ